MRYLLLVTALLAGCAQPAKEAPKPDVAAIRKAIETSNAAQTAAIVKGDISGAVAPYTVDAVVFDTMGRLLVIRRKHPPFAGTHALPGGFVDIGETVEAACARELKEETGLKAQKLTLIGVYSDPNRDPRGHTCSAAFLVKAGKQTAMAGDDAASVEWVENWRRITFAFDHRKIVTDAVHMMAAAR